MCFNSAHVNTKALLVHVLFTLDSFGILVLLYYCKMNENNLDYTVWPFN